MKTKRFRHRLTGAAIALLLLVLTLALALLGGGPKTPVRAVLGSPLAPLRTRQTATGQVRIYDRTAALALPGVQRRTMTATRPVTRTASSPYAQTHQDAGGQHSLLVGADLVLLYWKGIFLCGYGVASATTDPMWANVDEVGFLYVDGFQIESTTSAGIGSTADETSCDNFGAPAGAYWKLVTEAGGIWFDGVIIDGDTTVYGIQ